MLLLDYSVHMTSAAFCRATNAASANYEPRSAFRSDN